jgi:hypothetical protein
MAVGLRGRLANQSSQVQQDYMLLLSDLYYQGAPLASVRDRLLKLGFPDASLAVVQTADQLSSSPDKVKQQEAEQLHQFAESLASGVDRNATPIVAGVVPTAAADVTSGTGPTAVATMVPAVVLTAITAPTDVPAAVAAAITTTAPAATAAPTPATRPSPGTRTGTIVSADQKPVFLRHDPSTKSKAVASMPVGATVEIKSTVVGTTVNPGDNHWYRVTYGSIDGYVYSQFVQVGG